MQVYRLVHGGRVIVPRLVAAEGVLGRMRGLLGRSGLPQGEGLLLSPCNSVHTCFMRFPIDVLFVDTRWRVVRVRRALPPYRAAFGGGAARHAVEIQTGWADLGVLRPGDQLALVEAP